MLYPHWSGSSAFSGTTLSMKVLVIGGGGGIHQPLSQDRKDIQFDYKPEFHFLMLTPKSKLLQIDSYSLKHDFSGFEKKHILDLQVP